MSDSRALDLDTTKTVDESSPLGAPPPLARRSVLAAGIGTVIEFYEFSIFAALTPVIAVLFFPAEDRIAALLSTFAVYAVGFFVRPVGAIALGRLADRRGRKVALAISVMMMGAVTVLIGVMPTYAQAGVIAPLLLVTARVFQGLSVGGEYGTSSTYIVELAPQSRRGFYGSFVVFASVVGSVLGIFLILGLTLGLSTEALHSWGWRVPFLLGFPLLVVGLYLRYRTAESPEFEQLKADKARAGSPLRTLLSEHWRPFLTVIGICLGFHGLSVTVQAFLLSYNRTVIGLGAVPSLVSLGLSAAVGGVFVLVFGRLVDRFGKRAILLLACGLTVVLAYPSFLIIGLNGFLPALLGQMLLWVPLGAYGGAIVVTFAELFPTEVRASGFAIAYSLGSVLFAGTTPFFATLLTEVSGNLLAPAWLLIAAALITAVVVSLSVDRELPRGA